MTDPQKLLDMAYTRAAASLDEYSPNDLNALIKILQGIKKEDEKLVSSTVGGFLAKHVGKAPI
jgi:predicted esterase YcpF (UPF0227 family)